MTRFGPGDRVRTRRDDTGGHTRLPRYARGCLGTVDAVHGPWSLPEHAAAGRHFDTPVYTVRFDASELWGASAEPHCNVSLDLWEPYLEDADRTGGAP